ncbi:hypothetical protein [Aminobacter sp. AP02]|uniref:hypothetical protein n=1 Tax=Aminobacter sp. AP02 TaxID=2135737 RepID=UPI000D78DCCD|nr:hypothetical protein [Aminobacter sp. AP02]PWK65798.1 hypothetical protein C8K44_11513 [Aminobacter sp. AP02]
MAIKFTEKTTTVAAKPTPAKAAADAAAPKVVAKDAPKKPVRKAARKTAKPATAESPLLPLDTSQASSSPDEPGKA